MATRNLTEPFILMRNNALQSKHIYAEQNLSDRMALVSGENAASDNVELKGINLGDSEPPVWIDALEETQYILSRLRTKLDTLTELHAKQLTRPTLDDTSQEERQMEKLTREIGRAFSNGYRQVQTIKSSARHETRAAERQLGMSAVLALSSALQDLSILYRTAQSNYLQQMNSREERNRQFFTDNGNLMLSADTDSWLTEPSFSQSDENFWQSGAQTQKSVLLQIEETEEATRQAMEREQEVGHIVRSISDLNHIFKDLATMVHDQGSILDRIDYNIEQTQGQVQEGYKQLKKADSYQKTSRKMYCILILAASIIFLSFLFIVFKT
ncbi:syntaxin-16 [Venturia canescens]|uniref:syntaxin-16 n=1 Tax=Venturia canescens TaxID=32260 RepID=UPI001C9C20A2|nr:syntaxin-16 [Venturia canescens]